MSASPASRADPPARAGILAVALCAYVLAALFAKRRQHEVVHDRSHGQRDRVVTKKGDEFRNTEFFVSEGDRIKVSTSISAPLIGTAISSSNRRNCHVISMYQLHLARAEIFFIGCRSSVSPFVV
jgi:hypothetical protein